MMGVGRQFGDIVRFACQQGHRLFGEQELVCGPQGAWSDNPPSCHRVWCDPPVLGSGVRLPEAQSQGSHPHRAILELECREGHQARGDLRITCQANGRWSRPEGACHSKSERTIEKKDIPRSVLWTAKYGVRSHPSFLNFCVRLKSSLHMSVG